MVEASLLDKIQDKIFKLYLFNKFTKMLNSVKLSTREILNQKLS
jgi:hypothetical protein